MTSEGLSRQDGKGRRRGVEWPSIMLCCGVYGGFLAVTWFHDRLPWPIFAALGAVLLALQSSMQHEFIHGHPTSWRRLNRALASVPLSLWLPFESYRRSHLVHHVDERLTDPFDDPETYYWTAEDWAALGPLGRAFIRVHSTLAGRLLFGPAWNIGRYLQAQAMAILHGDRQIRRIWISHVPGLRDRADLGRRHLRYRSAFLCPRDRLSGGLDSLVALLRRTSGPRPVSSSAPPSSRTRRSSASCFCSTTFTPPITNGPPSRGTNYRPGMGGTAIVWSRPTAGWSMTAMARSRGAFSSLRTTLPSSPSAWHDGDGTVVDFQRRDRGKHERHGSIHAISHGYAPLAQLDRVSGFEPEGRRFESCEARQIPACTE